MTGLILSQAEVIALKEGWLREIFRKMKPQPEFSEKFHGIEPCHYSRTLWGKTRVAADGMKVCSCIPFPCPFRPGDTVYVKETWGLFTILEGKVKENVVYKADDPTNDSQKWRPSTTMPEWASRSHARIVSVRPERVREISEEDAIREGMRTDSFAPGRYKHPLYDITRRISMNNFTSTWETLHPGSWERNDWVWRIELEKVTK